MDDVKAVIEQATDAIGTPEAPAEAPKPEVKVGQAAKKVARKGRAEEGGR